MAEANEMQVGGKHYRTAGMQHWDFVAAAGLGYHDGNATKYVDRFPKKAGAVDLDKAAHYCQKCHELDLRPPPQAQAVAALTIYTKDRSDLGQEQRSILLMIVKGEYLRAKGKIEQLRAQLYD